MPFRIHFNTECAVPLETWKQNAHINAHCPRVKRGEAVGRKLAIVGGSPGVIEDLDELRAWDGDIWAVNYTPAWLLSQGISSTLYTVDAGVPDEPLWNSPVRKRLLSTACDPLMFTEDSRAFDMIETHASGFSGGTTSMTRAPWLALSLGYLDVSFFGCDGSYGMDGSDHIDRHEGSDKELIIRAGGLDYRTRPEFLIQCQELVTLFSEFGVIFKNRSRGLLKAMVDHPETWEIVGVSAAMKQHLEEVNGKQGIYEQPFRSAA
jgi:hypothetical protein